MPPKKVEEPERKPLIGRVGTNLKVGIVGIPNVGKSTFFNVLTKSQAAAENFPFCTIDPNENKQYRTMCDKILRELEDTRERSNDDYCTDIVKGSSLQDAKGYLEEFVPPWPPALSYCCPRASIYYAYTEDTNPFDRINEFTGIDRKNSGDYIDRVHFDPPLDPFTIRDPYDDSAAREKYLRSDPVCFAIFGKPGLGSEKLAQLLADTWNCVLISPEFLVREEIEKNNDKGKWIADSLERGEAIGLNIIMNLVESRVEQRDVMHRGYVVEGLPFIPNNPEPKVSSGPEVTVDESSKQWCTIDTCRVESESSSSQSRSSSSLSSDDKSSSPVSLKSLKLTKTIGTHLNILRRTTFKPNLIGEKVDAAIHALINPFAIDKTRAKVPPLSEKYEDYVPDQIERIFNTWPIKPTIIIYMICPDEDAIARRADFRFDPLEGTTVDTRFVGTVKNEIDDNHWKKYFLNRPSNASTNVKLQCDIYKRYALPIINRHVLDHNPQNVIRVDGRTSVSQMFRIISTRLRTLPHSRVILPKSIWKSGETFEGEGDDEHLENAIAGNFEDRSKEEIFDELANRSTISWRFRWSLSNWKYDCPVELAMGRTTEGKAEHAVRFMNKIFFLSSTNAMEIFVENPRPFLLPFAPKPNCKIAIFGPKYAGKSELSNSIARNYGANVVDVRELEKGLIDDRINANVADAVRRAVNRVIADLKTRLEAERQSRENDRCEALQFWFDEVKTIVEELDFYESEEQSEPPDFTIVRKRLEEYGLQFLSENLETLERIRQDENALYDYAPDKLRYEEPPIRELTEHDPEVAAILENEVRHLREEKIAVTNSEIAGLLISRIKMMPDEPLNGELLREPGWIVDGMYPDSEIWAFLAEAGVVFDDLIVIIEKEPYNNLIHNWKQFQEADDPIEQNESDLEDERLFNSRKTKDMESYIADIRDFEEKWENFVTVLEESEEEPFVCDLDKIVNLYETVSRHMNDRYRLAAKIMTEEEREREFEDTIDSLSDIDEEEEVEDEQLEESKKKQVRKDNCRLGDTGIYCPVALARNKVLWRGREEFSAMFLDKIYLCSSAEALNDFVNDPEAFNVPSKKPMIKMPLARVWIVGPSGSGKSSLAEMLSREYGMTHIDFSSNLDAYMRKRGISTVNESEDSRLQAIDLPTDLADERYNIDRDTILAFVQKYKKEDATLPHVMLDECILNFFKSPYDASATIFESFPNCLEDAEIALQNYAIPEMVIELECSVEKIQERLLPDLLVSFRKKENRNKNTVDEDNTEEEEEEEEEEEDAEDPEEFKDRLLEQIEDSYERKAELLDSARNRMEEEFIPWIKIDGEKEINTVFENLRKILQPLVIRESSMLERTVDVDPETAENLLECGYYFLSSFGRSCPVQMYERKIPIQMYLPMAERDEIYTVLHRSYVYFIAGGEAMKKFTKDPLKYLQRDSCDPVIPARISIIGPPKCGKSTLAERFARAYGMRVVTRGNALRWMTEKFLWTKTGNDTEELLRSGGKVTNKFVARAVELHSIDPRSSAQGYILDGFPANREEAEELALLNIRPMIVINLEADQKFCLTSSTINDEEDIRKPALYSPNLISHRYETWEENSTKYLDWLTKYAQNVVNVDATASKWAVWRKANEEFCSKFTDIKRYFREADYQIVHSLKNLSVSPYEFRIRQSPYESYCPACLHYEDSLVFSGPPPDRRGVVQFGEHFYWICSKHLSSFTENPQACLPPQATAILPSARPEILNEEIDLEHACWAKRLRADGNCIVTYVESLPEYKIIRGQRNLGILYEDNLYIFCSLDCRKKFLARPSMYAKVVIEYRETLPTIELKNMPTLEFLKETVADVIVKAVGKVAVARPKYPGMSPAASAAIYIAIFLKVHNVDCDLKEIGVYEEVANRMEALRRVPVPDARFDYLCEYFKPASKVPAFLNVVDIAGLVKGAAEGQGLGNAFLSHISACDAIFHLCRAFEDDDVTHIEGEVNPVRDLEIIYEELRLKDIEFLGIHLEKLEKLVVRGNDKKLKPEYDTLFKVKNILTEEKKHIRFADWSVNEIEILNKYLFLTSKPMIYLVNLSEKDYIRKKNKWLIKIKEWVDKNDPGAVLIPFSGAFENKVIDMDEAQRAKYFEESKVTSALDKIIVHGYKALQLQYFFTSGADEVKAWTIQKGTKAPQAAGRIHGDFEKGFIMAEVMKFEDFKNEGSESGVKAAGKYRQQGRNYVVEDGDIIFFKFNAGAGLKDAKKK